jgi:hypothetical protein
MKHSTEKNEILMQKYSPFFPILRCYRNEAKTSENIMAINKLIKKSNQFMIDVKKNELKRFPRIEKKETFLLPFFVVVGKSFALFLNSVDILDFSWILDSTQLNKKRFINKEETAEVL